MDYESPNQRSNSKAKIIAGFAVIAAVALIYFVSSALADKNKTAASSTSDTTSQSQTAETNTAPAGNSSDSTSGTSYRDGTYSASGSYRTPGTYETINVSLTLKDGVVTDSSVQQTPQDPQAVAYQADFKNNYRPLVVGKKLGDIRLSRVSGSSLTSGGFNTALDSIKSQAAANS